ncbi:mRNA splicing factor [Globomyces pollinis-pini]|nr:mRNA splicing factor [Globomyces pollinis-pini]
MSLTEKSEERKKKLEAFKRSRDGQIKFKTYTPESENLKDLVKEAPVVGPLATQGEVDTVEKRAEVSVKEAMEEEENRNPELDLTNLAPKKPNWDLKRDLEKKLSKLDRLFDIAATDLIRERLKAEGNLAVIGDNTNQTHQTIDEDDD